MRRTKAIITAALAGTAIATAATAVLRHKAPEPASAADLKAARARAADAHDTLEQVRALTASLEHAREHLRTLIDSPGLPNHIQRDADGITLAFSDSTDAFEYRAIVRAPAPGMHSPASLEIRARRTGTSNIWPPSFAAVSVGGPVGRRFAALL